MSCLAESAVVLADDIFAAWIVSGGLDPNQVLIEEPISIDKKNVNCSFQCRDGYSIRATMYWVDEDDNPRRYLWAECSIVQMPPGRLDVLQFLLERSWRIPAVLKIGVTDEGQVVLCVRGAIDGFSPSVFTELLDNLLPCAHHLFLELKERFDLPSLSETQNTASRQSYDH